jgi:hypothetical protein
MPIRNSGDGGRTPRANTPICCCGGTRSGWSDDLTDQPGCVAQLHQHGGMVESEAAHLVDKT